MSRSKEDFIFILQNLTNLTNKEPLFLLNSCEHEFHNFGRRPLPDITILFVGMLDARTIR